MGLAIPLAAMTIVMQISFRYFAYPGGKRIVSTELDNGLNAAG